MKKKKQKRKWQNGQESYRISINVYVHYMDQFNLSIRFWTHLASISTTKHRFSKSQTLFTIIYRKYTTIKSVVGNVFSFQSNF